jgi:hypothetical protein
MFLVSGLILAIMDWLGEHGAENEDIEEVEEEGGKELAHSA